MIFLNTSKIYYFLLLQLLRVELRLYLLHKQCGNLRNNLIYILFIFH